MHHICKYSWNNVQKNVIKMLQKANLIFGRYNFNLCVRYIFNATFDAKSECESGTPNVKRYNDFCAQVWDKGGKGLVLTSPSLNKKRGADGISIGDDICNWVKTEGKTPFVGKNSKKFPNGLEFGMYSNSCGNKLWDWAGRIHHEIVCCA